MHTILHVERSSFFQKIIRDILVPQGYTVLTASSVQAALTSWSSNSPDIILCGMELDDGRGQDLIRKLNEADSRTPCIIITSSESLAIREELFSLGVADYLIKQEISSDKLLSYIARFANPDPVLLAMQNMRIAILDDSRFELQVMESIFNLHKITKHESFTEPEDLLASNLDYEIFIIDLVLPRMSGEEVVSQIRHRKPDAVIVVGSSINHAKTVAHVLDSGANDYITKPFEAELFMARLKSTVRTRLLVEDVKKKQGELETLARIDGLTGVLNHRSILSIITEKLETYKKTGSLEPAVLMLDIDKFKSFNDTYGHQAGDAVLQFVCRHLEEKLPKGSRVGRYGGEEFLVIYDKLAPEDIRTHVTSTHKALTQKQLTLPDGSKIQVTYSGGLSFAGTKNLREIIAAADAALLEAKRQGRNLILETEA